MVVSTAFRRRQGNSAFSTDLQDLSPDSAGGSRLSTLGMPDHSHGLA